MTDISSFARRFSSISFNKSSPILSSDSLEIFKMDRAIFPMGADTLASAVSHFRIIGNDFITQGRLVRESGNEIGFVYIYFMVAGA